MALSEVLISVSDSWRVRLTAFRRPSSLFAREAIPPGPDDGPIAGPGMVLAWSIEYFLLGFAKSRLARMLIRGLVRVTLFWLKYFDYYLIRKPGVFDAASGYYFMGKKRSGDISSKALVKLYRGAMP